jgi:hypothetical protein
MTDFLFRGPIAEQDPDLDRLIQVESERQYRKIILIPVKAVHHKRFVKHWARFFRTCTLKGIQTRILAG